MRTQTFGVELEMTGISRRTAAGIAAEYFGTVSEYIGGSYDKYAAKDGTGRQWSFVSDSSIRVERGRNGEGQQVEMVTPIFRYEDIELLQELIRRLRKAGAKVNSSCGIHKRDGRVPLLQFHAPRRKGQGLRSVLLSSFAPSDNSKVRKFKSYSQRQREVHFQMLAAPYGSDRR